MKTWSMASYAAPSQSAWQNTWSNGNGNGNSGMWYPAPAVAAERVTAEGSADSDTGIKKVRDVMIPNLDPDPDSNTRKTGIVRPIQRGAAG